jgi:hypothetical protein
MAARSKAMFLNRRGAAQYRALASIIPSPRLVEKEFTGPRSHKRGPTSLRHESSSPARTLRPWVRIPHKTWMSVCVYSAFVLFSV